MNLGMDDWENSSGEHPQLLPVGCWAADLNPELDADVFANEVHMNSIMADEMEVRPETGSTSRPSYCSTIGSNIDISPRPLYDRHADWDRASTYSQKTNETGPIASYDSLKLGRSPPIASPSEIFDAEPEMLLQPETRPISHDQLVIEIKGIYAGLVMVEAKCIDIDEKQTAAAQEKDLSKKTQLKNDQWQSLIALHKQLLHEHHDFLLASEHPAASPALSRLAAKYSMPARMWRHGIHAFLEVLRHRLPDSMMALLFETVPTFEDTWIECLGDLGRYRMAIEDDEPRDRETWSNVARFWYNKAADKSPTIGRLYHHLTILARPYSLEQLSLYTRALTCITPFESTRGSIMTLFKPILQRTDAVNRRPPPLETLFIRAHGYLFTIDHANNQFLATVHQLEEDGLYDKYITKSGSKFKEAGVYCADANIAALFEYGSPKQGRSKATLRLVYEDARRVREYARLMREEESEFEIMTPELDSKTAVGLPNPDIEAFVLSEDDSIAAYMSQALRLGVSNLYDYARRVREKVTMHHAEDDHQFVRSACRIRSSPALTLTTCISSIVPITARTIPRDTSDEECGGSFPAAVIPLAHWRKLAFVIITLLMTQYLAYIKDPIFVWGCMMAVWAFGWLTIRADPSTTLSISVVVLLLWAISAYQYGHAAFSKHRISTRVGLIIIILSTVTLMTPSGVSTAQPELLLSFSLPLVSLILAAMVTAVAAMQPAEQNHALEARPQVHVPYIQEQGPPGRQQRRLRMAIEAHYRPVELPTTPGEGG